MEVGAIDWYRMPDHLGWNFYFLQLSDSLKIIETRGVHYMGLKCPPKGHLPYILVQKTGKNRQ